MTRLSPPLPILIYFKFHLTPSVPPTYLTRSVADYIDASIMRSLIIVIIIIIITEADEAKHGYMGFTYGGVCVCVCVCV